MDTFVADGKTVSVFSAAEPGAPVVYLNTFGEEGQAVFDALTAAGGPALTLVTISGLDWDRDMSPWDSPAVFKSAAPFAGGADDYLPKPFHTAELKARIKSVVRRSRNDGRLEITLGNVVLDPESCRVRIDGKEVELLKKEFDILRFFMQRPNHVVDKSILAEAVWGDHADQADNFHFVYAQMKNLRRKLSEAGADIEIKSVYGFGYKLTPPETA